MRPVHLVFGLGVPGLFVLRQIAKSGANVVGIGRSDDLGRYSRYGDNHVADTAPDIKQIVEGISSNGVRLRGHICSDQYLNILLSEYEGAFAELNLDEPDIDTLKLINDRRTLLRYCANLGFQVPREYALDPSDIPPHNYPVIVKWNTKPWWPLGDDPIGKTTIIEDGASLAALRDQIAASGLEPSQFVVQPVIPGEGASQFSYGGYFRDGVPVAHIVVNQVRQYPRGVSCYVVEVGSVPIRRIISDLVGRFSAARSYTGFLEMEFMVDPVEGQPYLLDANPRPWGWIGILGRKYHGFHQVFSGEKVQLSVARPGLLRWTHTERDVAAIVASAVSSRSVAPLSSLTEHFRDNLVRTVFDPVDPLPSAAGLTRFLSRGARRHG